MKSFLVAVDFSNCSVNALMHAAQLAYFTNSRIEMIWVNNPQKTQVTVSKSESTGLINEMNVQFEHIAEELQTKYPGLKVDYLIREGKVYKEIGLQAEESKSRIIVAGTHGRTGLEKLWMGSNVYRLVSTAPCPVLTVRSGAIVSDQFKTIILPIDSTVETREKVTITAELAHSLQAKVIVLKLYSTDVAEVRDSVDIYAQQAFEYLLEEEVVAEMDETEAKNLTVTTIEYAQKVNANLIVIMTEQEKKIANFLIGNFAHQMMSNSPIPVLSVRPQDL
jgi:nucleotide-binding universal stress UspA family protein